MPLVFGRRGDPEKVEEGRRQVDRLGERGGSRAGEVRRRRIVHEQRNVHDLLVHVHPVLRPEVVLAEQEAVVGGDHQRRVLPHVVLVEVVEQLAQQEVAHRDDGVVVGAQLLALGRQFVDAAVARPVADRAVPARLERLLEARRRIERLVRIEGLDLQEPVVGIAIALEELEAAGKALDRRELGLFPDEFTVDDVVAEIAARVGVELTGVIHFAQPLPVGLDHRLPRVALLAAHEFV